MRRKKHYSKPQTEVLTMTVEALLNETSVDFGDGKSLSIKPGNPPSNDKDDPYGGYNEAKGGSLWDDDWDY